MRKTIEVVAAVIVDAQGRIFATQRGYGEWKDWWEFPGGKLQMAHSRFLLVPKAPNDSKNVPLQCVI